MFFLDETLLLSRRINEVFHITKQTCPCYEIGRMMFLDRKSNTHFVLLALFESIFLFSSP